MKNQTGKPDRIPLQLDKPRAGPARDLGLVLIALVFLIGGCAGSSPLPRPLPPPNVDRGIELYRNGQYREAAQVLEQATSDSPDNPRSWTYLGLSRIKLGEPEQALAPLRKAVELDPDFAEAHYGLGLVHGYLKELDPAIAELERAVALNSTHAYAHYQLGLAYNEKKTVDRAILHLERFLKLEPNAPEAPQVKELLRRLR